MPRQTRYVKNKRVGSRGTVIRGDQIYTTLQGLVGGPTGQGYHEASNIQRYDLGARLVTGDGRVFRYGKVGSDAFTSMKRGVHNVGILVTENASIVSACAAGAKELTVTFNGDFWDIAIATNELYGGYISLYDSSSIRSQRMIVSNTSIGSGGGDSIIIGIDRPIVTAVGSTFSCEILANPYSNLVNPGGDMMASILGMPACWATAGQFFWIQTWGPVRITPTSDELGAQPRQRQYVFGGNGGILPVNEDHADYAYQHAGFLIEKSHSGSDGSAAPFVMLQISP